MKKYGDRLRSFLIWLVALPLFLYACVLVWLGSFVLRGRGLENLIKAGCRTVLLVCGIRVRVRGRDNLVPGRQYVVMMNHVNFFDPLVFQVAFPGVSRGVEEESQRAVESLRRAAAWIRLRPDFSFAILPEGTRTRDGNLGPFKRGGFLLALETGLDILPLVQSGAFRIARKGSLLIRPGRVDIAIEPAVPTEGFTKDNIGELVERVRGVFLRRLVA
jgi:1-acyl-sn-glycerol-3-phosphate acyltransferase